MWPCLRALRDGFNSSLIFASGGRDITTVTVDEDMAQDTAIDIARHTNVREVAYGLVTRLVAYGPKVTEKLAYGLRESSAGC